LIQGGADAAALGLVLDYYEAEEAASGGEAGAHGVGTREHTVEGEGHVVVFGELEDGEHAADGRLGGYCLRGRVARAHMVCAQFGYLFGEGEDAGLAGDYQEAVGGIAAEPP
jgi:hypothetical protein